ncbi:helix-turn-helix domain-containing protein [Sediminicurvatus halobius]|uniref:HTH cro/C1-type domain-containing protein n=1 Tax=Sediminicurvatus halobius TaxID=2182432 RepID=A0A2U2NA42_9GAMM|nr:helix-turn-helix transcriptional regulator [Spiribacter halobius]PWG65869.1 hypothetical protein DEM34_01000 [Spiribacter halobius]UEX77917.1 helix-turn-helix domain-containing protein [Spiribacter halobius]
MVVYAPSTHADGGMAKHGSYGKAIRRMRRYRGIPQDGMTSVVSRAYIGELERGLKEPTCAKVNNLCRALDFPPLTVHILAFADCSDDIGDIVGPAADAARAILDGTGTDES